jgi:hypothetical protein
LSVWLEQLTGEAASGFVDGYTPHRGP